MSRFIESSDLLRLAANSKALVAATQTLEEVLGEEPCRLIDVGDPSLEPVSLPAYRVRLARSNECEGPVTYGLEDFVSVLEALNEEASAVVVTGDTSTYVLLLDSSLTDIIAATAVDPPKSPGKSARFTWGGEDPESDD